MICVDLSDVGMAQPDKVLFEHLDVAVHRGDRVAVVGVNGSGKTTLLRILAGTLEPDEGTVRFGRGVRIAMLDQDPVLSPGTVREVLGEGWEVAATATTLGVQPLFERRTDELSGGQAKRVALAKVLAEDQHGDHDLVILDEPTNHLDLEAIEWLEERLASMNAALVIVTHDRHLLDRVTTDVGPSKVVELDGGRAFVHRAQAGSSAYATAIGARAERVAREAQEEATRKILARQELAWLRRGAPARSSKPKSRLRSAHEIVDGGPARADVRASDLDLGFESRRLGNQAIELEGIGQRFGDVEVLADVDLVIEPGSRLAVVGPNGSGKSTLLDIVAGRAEPSSGRVRRGKTVVVGYADQHSADLPPDAVVRELVAGPHRQPDHEDRALLERFWFDAPAQYAPVRMLSGGERRRLNLVMVLAERPNVLILDEPTNDLDLDTLRALESFFDDWPGAMIVSSHDRAFLDRVADHVLAVGDGTLRRVPGGVTGWLQERAAARSAPGSRSGGAGARGGRDGRSGAGGARAGGGGGGRDGAGGARGGGGRGSEGGSGGGDRRGRGTPRPADRGPSPSTIGRRLRETEKAMTAAQRQVDRLTEELGRTTDHQALAELGDQLAAAQQSLSELETSWLELAEQHDA